MAYIFHVTRWGDFWATYVTDQKLMIMLKLYKIVDICADNRVLDA